MTRPRWRSRRAESGVWRRLADSLARRVALLLLAPAGAAADLVLGRSLGDRTVLRLADVRARRRRRAKPAALLLLGRRLRGLVADPSAGAPVSSSRFAPSSASSASITSAVFGTSVSCWARESDSRELSASLGGALLPRPPLGLSLRSGLRHRQAAPRSARFLVRRVPAAPVAVLAQLDAVGRVPPRLIGLVIAPLALLASERHCDSNVSAGHWLLMLSVLGFKRGLLRSGLTHPPQKKDPAPRLWRGTRGAAKDSAEVGPGTNGPGAG